MKILVFCLIVIANISDNGKASVDSFGPASANVLLDDINKYSDNSCYRPCKFNVKPQKCTYKFKIAPLINDEGKATISVNEQSPGPPINVCLNDVVVIEVENKIPDQSIAIHWHGVDQKSTPFMDGVPMVTQCPIEFKATFKYAFRASSPGTFFYHADSVSHQSDGVFGALIVSRPQPLEPHSSLYDYDRINEHTMMISASFPKLLTGNLEDLSNLKPESLRINGEQDNFKVFVMDQFAYRLRLINAIGVDCPVIFSIDKHEITAIATDSRPVKPASAQNLLMYPGERMDVVVRATQSPGGYWVRVQGQDKCSGLETKAIFIYNGFNYTSMLMRYKNHRDDDPDETEKNDSILIGQNLLGANDIQELSEDKLIHKVYLGVNRNIVTVKETENDFRYISDAIPKKPFFPAAFGLQHSGVVQINGKSFLYPNAPYLLRPREVRTDMVCKVGEESAQQEPQCIQVLELQEHDVVEIAIVNEGFGSNDSYTFHMHGNSMQVISVWQNPDKAPISKEDFQSQDKDGKILRNTRNPPIKDTVTVPNNGAVIVRIEATNPGAWLLECRSCALSSLPAAVLISVPLSLPKAVLDYSPKCGNYRPPDVLLN